MGVRPSIVFFRSATSGIPVNPSVTHNLTEES